MRITDKDITRFTCGDCHIFARALSRETGWPIATFVDRGEPDLHAFVIHPSGDAVDIEGRKPIDEFKRHWGTKTPIKNWTWGDLQASAWCCAAQRTNWSYLRAAQLAPYVAAKTA